MPRAIFNGKVIAESERYETVEGNIYFPPDSVRMEYFTGSDRSTVCPWKGTAAYYSVSVDGETAENAAWAYPTPKQAAANIRDHIAFYPIVTVEP